MRLEVLDLLSKMTKIVLEFPRSMGAENEKELQEQVKSLPIEHIRLLLVTIENLSRAAKHVQQMVEVIQNLEDKENV